MSADKYKECKKEVDERGRRGWVVVGKGKHGPQTKILAKWASK